MTSSKLPSHLQNWKKFGNSEFDAAGPNVATTTVSDDVYMTFISSKEVRTVCRSEETQWNGSDKNLIFASRI